MLNSDLKFLILGKGNLGTEINHSLKKINISSVCISIRSLDSDSFCGDLRYDIIIDCMDLSHDLYPNYSTIQDRISGLRSKFLSLITPDRYYYVSTANLYVPSFDVIDENSQTYNLSDMHLTSYLKYKIHSEIFLTKKIKERLTILRPVSLWSYESIGTKASFFSDLLLSRKSSSRLPYRAGDENIISYMSYRDAVKLIINIVFSKHKNLKVCNISSWQWASRSSLKNGQLCDSDSSQRGRRISSIYYTKAELPHHLLELL
jgi:hypothetical protein